jgi:membrane-bound lytic murein transglycosylase D
MNYATEHNLTAVPPVISFYEADTVMVDQEVSLTEIGEITDVPLDLLTYLNPVYKRGVIPESDELQVLRLPTNKINTYIANSDKLFTPETPDFASGDESPLADYITKQVKKTHVVKRGETIGMIADKYNCTVSDIKRWNKFKGSKLYKGQRLTVYCISTSKKRSQRSTASKPAPSQHLLRRKLRQQKLKLHDGKYTWHVVQKGDTLYSIAKQYDHTVDEIKSLNNLNTNRLMPGTKLKIKVS